LELFEGGHELLEVEAAHDIGFIAFAERCGVRDGSGSGMEEWECEETFGLQGIESLYQGFSPSGRSYLKRAFFPFQDAFILGDEVVMREHDCFG
jgi:hypothetical protein